MYEIKKTDNDIQVIKSDLGNIWLFKQMFVNREKVKERINQLIKSILYLNRNIKGRNEILHPKLLIVGLYKNTPYKSYKDRIILSDEYEEMFEEKKESVGEEEIKIIRRTVKLKKPIFILKGVPKTDILSIDEALNTLCNIKEGLNNELTRFYSTDGNPLEKLFIFKVPEIEVGFE